MGVGWRGGGWIEWLATPPPGLYGVSEYGPKSHKCRSLPSCQDLGPQAQLDCSSLTVTPHLKILDQPLMWIQAHAKEVEPLCMCTVYWDLYHKLKVASYRVLGVQPMEPHMEFTLYI